MIDLTTLTMLAQAATPGPWIVEERRWYHDTSLTERGIANAAFIVACSPDTILGLVARVRQMEDALIRARKKLDIYFKQTHGEYADGENKQEVRKAIDAALTPPSEPRDD